MDQTLNLINTYITFHGNDGYSGPTIYSELGLVNMPTKCGHCGNVGSHNHISSIANSSITFNDDDMITVLSCPYCQKHTVHFMKVIPYKNDEAQYYYSSVKSIPSDIVKITFTDTIKAEFASFVKIYNQANTAEELGLSEIAGVGYRKAFEFLITDYLIKKNPDSKEDLESPSLTLGSKIQMLPDQELIDVAKASSYLGNDETHYSRRHPEMGINDLKVFIELVISDIERDLAREKAKQLINKPKTQDNQ